MTIVSGPAGRKGRADAGASLSRGGSRTLCDIYSTPETILLGLVLATFAASFAMAAWAGQAVDWAGFLPGLAPGLLLIAIASYARYRGTMPGLALYMIALGIFLSFMCASAIFVFLLFPLSFAPIDPLLIRLDGYFGYSWPGFVTALATMPLAGKALGYVYLSSIWQLFLVLTVLGWMRREVALYRFLIVGVLGLGIASLFWWVFPSFGPATMTRVSPEVEAKIGLVVNAAYGDELLRLAREGAAIITPEVVKGVIAFPSFHMIMACMVVWFSRRTSIFLPMLVLNIAMVPAILAHGGHYLVDLIGGVAVFALAVWVSSRIAPEVKPAAVPAG